MRTRSVRPGRWPVANRASPADLAAPQHLHRLRQDHASSNHARTHTESITVGQASRNSNITQRHKTIGTHGT